jgi:cytidine deaminase
VLTHSGELFDGANIENASYGASICAERTTITQAVLKGHRSFKAIAISSDLTEEFISPCGICRQFIREFGTETPIYMFKPDGTYLKSSIRKLLPMSFGPEQLQ